MRSETKRVILQIILFITTFITTTLAGTMWANGKTVFDEFGRRDFVSGFSFSIPLLLILTVHEFGHYFTAMYHRVKATLPYFIPLPPLPFFIGTMGAVIRMRGPIPSNKQNFDIGIAGPLAGFVTAFFILWYGFATLPPAEYIFEIHPEYKKYGLDYAEHVYSSKNILGDVTIGKNLLFRFFETFVADPSRVPNPHEVMHYPILFAGFLSLIFTFMNLLPIGQLDGGHVLYGLAGFKKHRIIATVFFIGFMFYAGLGNPFIDPYQPQLEYLIVGMAGYLWMLYLAFTGLYWSRNKTIVLTLAVFASHFLMAWYSPNTKGYVGWLIFAFVVGRFVKIPHPPCEIEEPLDTKRIILGWLALIIFILCFSPAPLMFN